MDEDRFDSDNRTNLLEDMVYEKYDHSPTVSPDSLNAAEDGADADAGGAPAGDAPAGDAAGEKRPKRWSGAPVRKARFSDRVKINQALRLMTETFLGEKTQEQELFSFFKIPLEHYLNFLNSSGQEAAEAVALRIIRVLTACGADMSRFEAAKDMLRRERLWIEQPRVLWQERIHALTGALAEQLDQKETGVE
jgi:hypothetical protein